MPTVFMATNRLPVNGVLSNDRNPNGVTWWSCDGKPLDQFDRWTQRGAAAVVQQIQAIGKKPVLFVHGFNESAQRAEDVGQAVLDGLGDEYPLILFLWNSAGHVWDYLGDRERAEKSAPDLLEVLEMLDQPNVLAHSMGNYVIEQALKNTTKPLINGLAMVAADVPFDDLKKSNIAKCSKKIVVLYCPVDGALDGSSLLRLGVFRLGMSGPIQDCPANCQAFDCTGILPAQINPVDLHGEYFKVPACYEKMKLAWEDAKGAAQ